MNLPFFQTLQAEWRATISIPEKRRGFVYGTLLILCFLVFSNSLDNPFLMDDYSMILTNKAIGDAGHLQIFPFGSSRVNGAAYLYYRPVLHLLFFISFRLFGYWVFGYHVFNFILFTLCGLVLFHFCKALFGDWKFAFLASALFCAHPINGVLVNYTTTAAYEVLILAMLGGFLCSRQWIDTGRRRWQAAGLLLFGLALLCHEIAMAFPFYLAAMLYFAKRCSIKKTLMTMVPSLILLAVFFLFRMQYASLKTGVLDHIGFWHLSWSGYLASFASLIRHYLFNLIFLRDIVLMWATPVVRDGEGVIALVLISAFLIAVRQLFYHRRNRPFALGLSWFLIGLGPLALACFSRPEAGFIMAPHWLFFSTIGFCIFLASAIMNFKDRCPLRWITVGIACLLGSYVLTSREYNKLWGHEKAYCQHMLALSPDMQFPAFWLADVAMREGDWQQARAYLERTLNSPATNWQTYANLGFAEMNLGNDLAATAHFHTAIRLNPRAPESYHNLAIMALQKGDYEGSIELLKRAMAVDFYFLPAKKTLASIDLERGENDKAKALLNDILRIDPRDAWSLDALENVLANP